MEVEKDVEVERRGEAGKEKRRNEKEQRREGGRGEKERRVEEEKRGRGGEEKMSSLATL